jgi:hypothetical protein
MKKQYKMFVFGETLQKAINQLPETEQLRYYRIIVEYGLDGIEPELNGFEAAVWVQMKAMIDNTMPKKRGAPEGNRNAKQKNNSDGIDLFESIETISDELNLEKQKNNSDLIESNEKKSAMYNVNVNENVNENENENENERTPLSLSHFVKIPESDADPPDLPPKNYSMIFEEVKSKWKEITGQETREFLLTVAPAKREKFINTLALYSIEDIENAIRNYWYARGHPEEYEIGSRIYGNLFGFLENGVSQFYEDDVAGANFRRKKDVV